MVLCKRPVIAAIILVLVWSVTASGLELTATLTQYGPHRVLHVWGTSYERGYAQGYLLSDDILKNLAVYVFPPEGSSPIIYEMAKAFVLNVFQFDQDILDEAGGMIDGMVAAGADLYSPTLNRQVNEGDILTLNGITELSGMFCATLSAWGDATQNDVALHGDFAIAHNTDYALEPEDPYYAGIAGIVIAQSPRRDGEQRIVSISTPGMLGITAGMNESGVGVVLNGGQYRYSAFPEPVGYQLSVWNVRNALADVDANGDGINSIGDLLDVFEGTTFFSPGIIQLFDGLDDIDPPAAVLEANAETRALRLPEEDPNLHDVMVTLNWEDKLMPERPRRPDLRYWQSIWLVNWVYGGEITTSKMWDYLKQTQGGFGISVTLHSMVFIPAQKQVGVMLWSAEESDPRTEHRWYSFNDLFREPSDTGDDDTAQDDNWRPLDDDDADDDEALDDDTIDDSDEDDDGSGCAC